MRKVFLNIYFLLSLSFALRLFFCFFLFPEYFSKISIIGEQYYFDNYVELAQSLIAGNGFTLSDGTIAFHRPPLYVLFLCIPLWLAHGTALEIYFIQTFQALFFSLGIITVVKIVSALCPSSKFIPILSGYLYAFWPFSIWISRITVPENLLIVLVPLALYAAYYFQAQPTVRSSLFLGVSLALLCLCHASYMAFVVAVFFVFLLTLKSGRKLLLLTFFVFLLSISPWILRNYLNGYHSPQIATGFGQHYFIGWYYYERLQRGEPYFTPEIYSESHAFARDYVQSKGLPVIENDKDRSNLKLASQYDKLASEHLFSHITDNIKKVIIKIPLMWIQEQSFTKAVLNVILLIPFFFMSIFCVFRHFKKTLIYSGTLLFVSAAFALVCVECAPMRYALPLYANLVILSAVFLNDLSKGKS